MTETIARPAMLDIGRREMAWMDLASCASYDDPDLWFRSVDYYGSQYDHLPHAKAREMARKKDRARAREICWACPVRAECLAFAYAHESPEYRHGIWGGMTPSDRTKAANAARKRRVAA